MSGSGPDETQHRGYRQCKQCNNDRRREARHAASARRSEAGLTRRDVIEQEVLEKLYSMPWLQDLIRSADTAGYRSKGWRDACSAVPVSARLAAGVTE